MTVKAPKSLQARASRAYASQTREAAEEQWILGHLPLVRHIVQKVAARGREDVREDLISAGTLGLVKAARGYDPAKEAEFKTYAYIRIRGAVIDELRRRSPAPPAVHRQIRRVQDAYQQWVAERGAPPEDAALAEALAMPVADLYRILEDARKQYMLSLDGGGAGSADSNGLSVPDPDPGPADRASRNETLELLAAAIRELPERDRLLILLYYERDLTMKETAEVLGITESRVSQLHASAVFKLSMRLRRTS